MTGVPIPAISPKAMAALAYLWIVAECRTTKGRRKATIVRDMARRAAQLARIRGIRAGKVDPEDIEAFETIAALIEAAEDVAGDGPIRLSA